MEANEDAQDAQPPGSSSQLTQRRRDEKPGSQHESEAGPYKKGLWITLRRLVDTSFPDSESTHPSVESGISVERPQTHQLPRLVMWSICTLISVLVAATNAGIVQATYHLVRLKSKAMQIAINEVGPWAGTLVLTAWCALFAALGAALVVTIAPVCAGGGLPEMKGYLNGNRTNGLFRGRNFAVRLFGTIASVVAGFPIGREGPTISLGCNVGYGVVQAIAKSYVRRWVNIDTTESSNLAAVVVDEGRFLHAKRLGCALGGAAGMAAIFDAPIGGLLYMLEEVTEAAWTPELTLRTIVGTVLCVFVNRALITLSGNRITDFLIYVTGPQVVSWTWKDLPVFVVLAVLLGVLSSSLTHVLSLAFRCRKRLANALKRYHPFGRIGECALHAAVCALVIALASWIGGCRTMDDAGPPVDELQRFHCPEGQYAPVAELLMSGSEESIKLFYTGSNDGRMEYSALAIVFVAYTALFVGTIGLAIPMGTFIPAMFVGGLIGRFVGKFLFDSLPLGLAKPHIYAVVGSAAMLSAFTRQTLAIVVFMIECVNDLHLIPPLMLTVFVSHGVASFISEASLDEQLIEIKGVPFLEPELPPRVERRGVLAADLCDDLPEAAMLPPEASAVAVRQALATTKATFFPVVSGSSCVGLATRPRLQAALRALSGSEGGSSSSASSTGVRQRPGRIASLGSEGVRGQQSKPEAAWSAEVTDGEIDHMISSMLGQETSPRSRASEGAGADGDVAPPPELWGGERMLPLPRLMDAAPYTVLENMPAPRLYPLFTRLGIRALCVISTEGQFRGVISRDGLIANIHGQHELPGQWQAPKSPCFPAETAAATASGTLNEDAEAGVELQSERHNSSASIASFDAGLTLSL